MAAVRLYFLHKYCFSRTLFCAARAGDAFKRLSQIFMPEHRFRRANPHTVETADTELIVNGYNTAFGAPDCQHGANCYAIAALVANINRRALVLRKLFNLDRRFMAIVYLKIESGASGFTNPTLRALFHIGPDNFQEIHLQMIAVITQIIKVIMFLIHHLL